MLRLIRRIDSKKKGIYIQLNALVVISIYWLRMGVDRLMTCLYRNTTVCV